MPLHCAFSLQWAFPTVGAPARHLYARPEDQQTCPWIISQKHDFHSKKSIIKRAKGKPPAGFDRAGDETLSLVDSFFKFWESALEVNRTQDVAVGYPGQGPLGYWAKGPVTLGKCSPPGFSIVLVFKPVLAP